jgi:hypothetical protein
MQAHHTPVVYKRLIGSMHGMAAWHLKEAKN